MTERTALVCLHGFTQNGTQLRAHLRGLADRLSEHMSLSFPDAPHVCSQATVDRLYAMWGLAELPPPYLCWWDATDDGRSYRGWETTLEQLWQLCSQHQRVGILGFSQGAMLASALAALAARGEFPALRFGVFVAGGIPRSDALRPLLETPIDLPSLHVWGERDALARQGGSPALAERFVAERRSVTIWPGPHAIPAQGFAADAIVDFVRAHA